MGGGGTGWAPPMHGLVLQAAFLGGLSLGSHMSSSTTTCPPEVAQVTLLSSHPPPQAAEHDDWLLRVHLEANAWAVISPLNERYLVNRFRILLKKSLKPLDRLGACVVVVVVVVELLVVGTLSIALVGFFKHWPFTQNFLIPQDVPSRAGCVRIAWVVFWHQVSRQTLL